MDLNLAGVAAVVTGASRGIGRSIAEVFLEEGARVMITARGSDSLENARAALAARWGDANVRAFAGDAADPGSCDALAAAVERAFGGLDALVCNAGDGRSVPPGKETPEEWDRVFRNNLAPASTVFGRLVPLLERSRRAPSAVFVASIAGLESSGAPVAYAAAKAAVIAFAKNVAVPMGRKGVRIHAICPGNILFPGSVWERKRAEHPAEVERLLGEVPMGRFGTPREVAEMVVFLSSPRAGFSTGDVVVVDGGQIRCIATR